MKNGMMLLDSHWLGLAFETIGLKQKAKKWVEKKAVPKNPISKWSMAHENTKSK